jgi:peptide methionine sulfoxide reductase msrA/msrB
MALLAAGCAPADVPFPSTALAKETRAMVRVYVFDKEGELVGPLETPKLSLTAAEWHKRLTAEQFKVLRSSDTERPFCGILLDNKEAGVYTCAGCGLPLFSSDSKFHSGTGWPSFFQPIAKGNVAERVDRSHGMSRTEINCARCDGHLGHVFDDGPKPTGLRFCLNSASLKFTPSDKLKELADPLAEKKSAKPSTGDSSANGVIDVESGYSGGSEATANYDAVCSGRTGHAEVIRIHYNPERISYDQLLDVFFDAHDPTQLNAQGNDEGTQYRSAVFYANAEEQKAAEAKIKQLTAAHAFSDPIVTTLEPLHAFFPAEGYHQDYARLNPMQPYILQAATPKVCKVKAKHAKLIRKEREG